MKPVHLRPHQKKIQHAMKHNRAARAGFDLLVAAGGDGTINEVVNGIAPLKRRLKWPLFPLERRMTMHGP